MKRTLAFFLAVIMILGILPMSAFAADTATLSFSHDVADVSSLKAGDTFTVTATLTNNPGFAAFQFDLDWDNTVVEFTGFSLVKVGAMQYFSSDLIAPNEYDQSTGVIVVGASENITADGMLFEANFTVLKEGDAGITFKKEWPSFELKQTDQTDVSVTVDESALDELVIPHIHNYSSVVTAPTCTAGGYTTYTCSCGDSYVGARTEATGHSYEDGVCTVCGNVQTVIPEGATFTDVVADPDGKIAITKYDFDMYGTIYPYYHLELPEGTKGITITYPEGSLQPASEFGYMTTFVVSLSDPSNGLPAEFAAKTNDDGSISVTIGVSEYLVEEAFTGSAIFFMADSGPLEAFTFSIKEEEPESSFPFTITANGTAITAVEDGTEYSNIAYMDVPKYVATVPAGTTSFTISNTSGMAMMALADPSTPLASGETSCTVNISGNAGYLIGTTDGAFTAHLYIEMEEPESSFPFTITANGTAITAVEDGTEYSNIAYMDVPKYVATVPAGTTSFTISNTSGMAMMALADPSTPLASGETSCTVNISGNAGYLIGTTDGAFTAHLYIEMEEAEEPEPGFGIELVVGGEKIELVSAGTEKCGMLTATIFNVTLPAGTEEITINNITDTYVYSQLYVYKGGHNGWKELGKNAETVTLNLAECGTTFCIQDRENLWYHLNITVEEPTSPVGYTVTMPADISIVTGETASIPVVVDNADGSAYNAFDMSFTYDASKLELTSTEIEGMTVTDNDENGTVRVQRYGSDLTVGAAAFTLTFEAIGTGETTVTATEAKVGIAENAHELDAADATILDDATVITIGGYSVTLPDDFEGAATVKPGEDYTFTAKDKNYDYDVTAKIGDTEITVTDNGNGTFTIPANQITGNIVITSTKEGKTFDVSLGDDMTGATSAQYMTPYTATLTKADGYTYDLKVKIGGADYTGFTYDEATGVVTIPGADITGKVEFNSNKDKVQPSEYTVTFEGNGAGDVAEGAASKVEAGADYVFTLNKAEGYTYTVSYKMGDSTESVALTEADGKYTIEKVNGNLVITIEKESDLAVEVGAYVEMDGKTVFLVRATGTLADGKAYAYNGDTMYYSNVYQAWSWLVIVEEGNTFTADDAKANITAVEAEYTTLDQTFNVNMTSKVDVNDAQLVYNIYNCEYNDFSVATMQKFLYADTNGDKIVDTLDAAAVVNNIP